jgi:site-specific recombinase XerD
MKQEEAITPGNTSSMPSSRPIALQSSRSIAASVKRFNASPVPRRPSALTFKPGSATRTPTARTSMLRGIERSGLFFLLPPVGSAWPGRLELSRRYGMRGCEPRWEHFPTAAGCAWARRWLAMQANHMLAKNTIDSYSRSMEDFLGFAGRVGISPESATTEHVAEYVRDLCTRENPAQPKTVYIDSRAGLSNATVHLRLTVVRLFYDFLVEEGVRRTNPVGHGNSSKNNAGATRARALFHRHRKLPWIPSEEQWQAILSVARREPLRNRLMLALSYDAALRRQELLGLETADIDPAHRLLRTRAERTKNCLERIVPYSEAAGRQKLLAQLTDVPTPAGPTPRQLQSGLVQIEPTKERRE